MRADARMPVIVVALVLGAASAAAGAFEPGTKRVCEPSADRSRFECREVNPGTPPTAAPPSAPAATAEAPPEPVTPAPALADQPAAVAPAPPAARSLPNYLLQDPASARASMPAAEPEPEPAVAPPPQTPAVPPAAPAAAEAAIDAEATTGEAQPPSASVVSPIAPALAEKAAEAPAAAEPAAGADPAPATTSGPPRPATPVAVRANAADASAFRRLAGNRYTVEIARARTPGELGALVAALSGIDGTLYLIGLRTPEGTSHSLVWSDFPSIEDAREARTTLPTGVAITSGWPRRIGPLQAELIQP